jgi:hypothetical protein
VTTPAADERRPCAICRHHLAQQSYRTCAECSAQVLAAMDDVVLLYRVQVLDPEALLPTASPGGSTSAVFGPRSPTSDALLDLTDRRPTAEGDPRDVQGVLGAWVDAVREAYGLPPRPRPAGRVRPEPSRTVRCWTAQQLAHGTVAAKVSLLRGLWWWIRGHDAVAQFARDLFLLRDRLRDLAGESHARVRIGRCPTPVDAEPAADGTVPRCGQLLLARVGDRLIKCPACNTPWPWLSWPALADKLAEGA